MNDFEIPNQVLITTDRLVLREFTLMDAAAVFAYSTKAEAHEFAEHPPHTSIYDTEEMLQHFLEWQFSTPRRNLVLAITLKSNTRQVIGDIALTTTDEVNREAELGFMLDPAHWHKGYGTEAATALIAYAFSRVGWRRIAAACHKDNLASQELLRRAGLTPSDNPPTNKPGLRFNPHMRFFSLER